jgi:hypothetical protein
MILYSSTRGISSWADEMSRSSVRVKNSLYRLSASAAAAGCTTCRASTRVYYQGVSQRSNDVRRAPTSHRPSLNLCYAQPPNITGLASTNVITSATSWSTLDQARYCQHPSGVTVFHSWSPIPVVFTAYTSQHGALGSSTFRTHSWKNFFSTLSQIESSFVSFESAN